MRRVSLQSSRVYHNICVLTTHLSVGKGSGQRRGPKGYFKGSRKEYLERNLPEYLASRKGSRQDFWHKLMSGWWTRFPWKLGDDEEPPSGDPTEMARLAEAGPSEVAQKKEVEKCLQEVRQCLWPGVRGPSDRPPAFQRLKRWFINRASASNGSFGNALSWQPLLQRLHQIRNTRPRRRSPVQQFMLDHSDEVSAAVASRCADGAKLTNPQLMNLRYEVARSLLGSKDPSLTEELGKKATIQHEAALNEWSLVLEDISTAEDVSQYVLFRLLDLVDP